MSEAVLHHRVDGPADGEVLLMGPSLGTDLHLLDAQAAALSDGYRVVRYDLPGHGGSPLLPAATTVGDLAAAVLRLLDGLGIATFHHAGVSLGGAIGLQLALDAPHRLRRLVVIASAARFPDPSSWAPRAARVRREGTGFLVPSRTGAWFTADFARHHPDEAQRLLTMLGACDPQGYATCCEAVGAFDVRSRLAEIRSPTLTIAGEEDPATPPETVERITAGIPGARHVDVPGASHLVSAERPDLVSDAIRHHLGGRRADRARTTHRDPEEP